MLALTKERADIKLEIDKLRAELERRIESYGEEDLCLDTEIYKLSTDIDHLINVYVKAKQVQEQKA